MPIEDGGAESSPSDAGTVDAVSDAPLSDGDANLPFCARYDAWACSDFSALPVEKGFNSVLDSGGLPSLDDTLSTSEPSSLRIRTQATSGSASFLLGYQHPNVPSRISASASFNIRQLDPSAEAGAGLLSIVGPGPIAALVVRGTGQCSLDVAGFDDAGVSEFKAVPCGALPMAGWVRVKVTVTFPQRAKIEIDGMTVFDGRIPDLQRGSFAVSGAVVGLRSTDAAAQEVLIDDVLIEP